MAEDKGNRVISKPELAASELVAQNDLSHNASDIGNAPLSKNSIDTAGNPISQHFSTLPILRLFIVVLIATGYISTMPYGPDAPEVLRFLGYDPSWYGVSLLFFISGFLASKTLSKSQSASYFLASRIARNFPVLLLFALLVVLAIYPLLAELENHADYIGGAKQHLVYLFSVLSCFNANAITPGLLDQAQYPNLIQGSLWTFRWGLLAYCATTILWAIGWLKNAKALLVITTLTCLAYIALMWRHTVGIQFSTLEGLSATGLRLGWVYLAGMSVYFWRDHFPRKKILAMIGVGLIGVGAILFTLESHSVLVETLVISGLCLWVLILLDASLCLPKLLQKMPDLSLSFYVFIWPVTQIILDLHPTMPITVLYIVSMIICLVFSFLVWYVLPRRLNPAFTAQFIPKHNKL